MREVREEVGGSTIHVIRTCTDTEVAYEVVVEALKVC